VHAGVGAQNAEVSEGIYATALSFFDVSDMQQRWLPEFQYFRAFAILEVIVFHVAAVSMAGIWLLPSPQREIVTTIAASTSFAVSQFVFISGIVLYNKYKRDFSLRGFYKKRVNSVLWPYLIFSTFYFFYPAVGALLSPAVFQHSVGPVSMSGVQLLCVYLISLATGNIGQMWFILLILQLYVLYPFIAKVYNHSAKHPNIMVGALAALFIVQILYTWISLVVPPYIGGQWRGLFVSQIFYFVLGIFVCDHYDSIKNKVTRIPLLPLTILVVPATLYYGVAYFHYSLPEGPSAVYVWLVAIVGPLYSLLLIVFFLKICILWREPHSVVTRSMERIGEDSFGIYLTHMFYVAVFGGVLIRLGVGLADLLFYPIVVVSVLVASYVTVHLIYRLPLSIIIGRPRKNTAV